MRCCRSFAGAWTKAMGFLGAVAGSAAGALLSSTRGGTRPREHAIWMAFGAAMGIEGNSGQPGPSLNLQHCTCMQPALRLQCASSVVSCPILCFHSLPLLSIIQ